MGSMKDLFGDTPYEPPKRDAYARHTDPKTSHDAAEGVKVTAKERAVYQAIKSQGNHGANWAEVTRISGIDKATVSPRFKPLMKKGAIKIKLDAKGEIVTRPGFTNRQQQVYVSSFI